MIELPKQLKNSIQDSPVTSLNCFIHIYKTANTNVPIQDQNINESQVVRLSMGEFSLNVRGEDATQNADTYMYEPLLTKPPQIQNKIDLIKNKHTITSAKLRINNILYKGQVFSDRVRELWGRPCEIYFCSGSAEYFEDAMLVYTAVIKRYAQTDQHVDLTLEDISTFKYDQNVPVFAFPDDETVPDNMRGKSYPMIYGYNNQVPCVRLSSFNETTEEWEFNKLVYENPNIDILGLIEQPFNPYSLNPYLKSPSHYLNQYHMTPYCQYNGQEWPKDYLYVEMEGKLLPIQRQILNDTQFDYWNDISVHPSMPLGTLCYEDTNNYIRFTTEYANALSIMLASVNSSLQQQGAGEYDGPDFFLWSRIYRPIRRVTFFDSGTRDYYPDPSFNDGDADGMLTSRTWFFGIGPDRNNHAGGLEWNRTVNLHLTQNGYFDGSYFALGTNDWSILEAAGTYDQYNYNVGNGDGTWWFCTELVMNRSYDQGVANDRHGTKDLIWQATGKKGEQNEFAGEFPVHYIQNGSSDYGMFCESSVFTNGESYAYAKFHFDDYYNGTDINAITKTYAKLDYNLDVAASSDWNLFENQGGHYNGNVPFINSSTVNAVGFMGFTKNDKPVSEAVKYWNSTYYDENNTALSRAWDYRYMDKNDVLKWYDEAPDNVFKGFGGGETANENFKYNGYPYGPEHWESYGDPLQPNEDDVYERNHARDNDHWFDVDKTFDTLGKADYINWAVPSQVTAGSSNNLVAWSKAFLKEYYMFQDVIVDDVHNRDFYVSVAGRIFNDDRDDFDSNDNRLPIQTPDKILGHIFDEEIGGGTRWFDFSNIDPEFKGWRMNFVLDKQTKFKSLVEDVFSQTLSNTRFEPNGTISFLSRKRYLKSGIEGEDNNFEFSVIDSDHVEKYKFDLTKNDDLYNRVNVRYDFDYVTKQPKFETGTSLRSLDNSETFLQLEDFYKEYYSDGTNSDYFAKHEEGKAYSLASFYKIDSPRTLEIIADKIQDELSARKLQRKLLMWHCNQHLLVDLTLSNSYINLQVGDYFQFNELLDGKKAFGFDYSKNEARNGQLVYNKFIITETRKDGKNVKIKALQVHRLELGFPDGFFDENVDYYDNGNIVDIDGNNLNNLFDLELGTVIDPTIIVDDDIIEEGEFVTNFFSANWIPAAGSNQDTNLLKFTRGEPVTCVIDTNYFDADSELFYKLIFATTNHPIDWLGEEFEADVLYGRDVTEHFDFNISSTDSYQGRIMTISPREDNLLPHPDADISDIPNDLQVKMVLYISTVSFEMTDPDIPYIDELPDITEGIEEEV